MPDVANQARPEPPDIEPLSWDPFPAIDLRQFLRMSDDTGIFQHAIYGMPDPNHGYCIDDNARALIAGLLHAKLRGYDERTVPLHRYLTFITYAFNEKTRTFRNFMGYDRRWLEDEGSQDSQGRTIWTLGLTARHAPQPGIRQLARTFMHKGLPAVEKFGHIRSWAFALLGLDEWLAVEDDDYGAKLREQLAQRLFDAWRAHATPDWPWWEDLVTYDNAKLSHAMIVAGRALGRADMLEVGLATLRWLLEVQTTDDRLPTPDRKLHATAEEIATVGGGHNGSVVAMTPPGVEPRRLDGPHLSIIGNDGWLNRNGHRARFDQQPLEAYAMIDACLLAADVTGDERWAHHAWRCFEWFRGHNDLGLPLYNPYTGGCHDGLLPNGVNANQGAESILAYLLSVLQLHHYRARQIGRIKVVSRQTIGYAIVGVSSFAEFCLQQYRRLDAVQPVAVWNRTASKARSFAESEGLKAYDDLPQMLSDPGVQLVHVATTPASHAELVLPALRAGKHVLVEKPIAVDPADATRMVATARERDLVLAVNFMMRFGPLSRSIRSLIERGLLGELLQGGFENRAGDAGLGADHWFWDWSKSGGIFIEHGVHSFDLMRYWLGRGGEVEWAQRLKRPGADLFDQVKCSVRYGPQTSIDFYHGFLQPSPLDEQEYRLVFERGYAVVTGWIPSALRLDAVVTGEQLEAIRTLLPDGPLEVEDRSEVSGRVRHRGSDTPAERHVRLTWRDARDKQTIYGESLQALMVDVAESIRDRARQPEVSGEAGVDALQLAAEATRQAKLHTP